MTQIQTEMQELFQKHELIIKMAIRRDPFGLRMPDGGMEAIADGVAAESDPTWMYSDDPRVRNGFTLTNLGRTIATQQGWECSCAGHRKLVSQHQFSAVHSLDGMCRNFCWTSMQDFGPHLVDGEESCRACVQKLESREQEPDQDGIPASRARQVYPRR